MATDTNATHKSLGEQIYQKQQDITGLLRLVYDFGQGEKLDELLEAQQDLADLRERQTAAEAIAAKAVQEEAAKTAASRQQQGVTRSMATTGTQVTVLSRMDYVPTAYYHLLHVEESPLVECRIESKAMRRLRITAYIEEYSAKAVATVEIQPRVNPIATVTLLPTLFAERVREIRELTRATLNVLVENLDPTGARVEEHLTHPIWLLSCNSATFEVQDPQNTDPAQRVKSFYPYLGAFVTPNHPRVQRFLRDAAGKHFNKQLTGDPTDATAHAAAIYTALKEVADIVYVNSTLAFNATAGSVGQRVRLPYECLEEKQANCLDGVLLFASLLEALGQDAAILLIPQHAVVGWRTGPGDEGWSYVETTMIRTHDFEAAQEQANDLAARYARLQKKRPDTPDGKFFRRLELATLRSKELVTPIA